MKEENSQDLIDFVEDIRKAMSNYGECDKETVAEVLTNLNSAIENYNWELTNGQTWV